MAEESWESKKSRESWGGTLEHLAALAGGGGHVAFGELAPMKNVALAMEGERVHAALMRRSGETLDRFLKRLDNAVGVAVRLGEPVHALSPAQLAEVVARRKRESESE